MSLPGANSGVKHTGACTPLSLFEQCQATSTALSAQWGISCVLHAMLGVCTSSRAFLCVVIGCWRNLPCRGEALPIQQI